MVKKFDHRMVELLYELEINSIEQAGRSMRDSTVIFETDGV